MEIGSSERVMLVSNTNDYLFVRQNGEIIRVTTDNLIGKSILKLNEYFTLKRQTFGCYVVFC